MGLLTVAQFQTELHAIFGARGVSNERMLLWLNFAYKEICGAIEFEGMKSQLTFDTIEGTYAYELPERFLQFITIWDNTNKQVLLKLDTQDFGLLDLTENSRPTRWGVRNNTLWITPPADDVYEIQAVVIQEPEPLVLSSATTVLPATWDMPILLMAVHFGHLAFENKELAMLVYDRAMKNVTSRKTDEEWLAKTPALGLRVAWEESDLIDQE